MKILIFCLYCLFLFYLGICKVTEECEAINHINDKAPNCFDCNIYIKIIDLENGNNCGSYEVEFVKYNCLADWASSLMSYKFSGCYLDGETTYINNITSGFHVVTITYKSDYVDFRLKDGSNILHSYSIDGSGIALLTNYGMDSRGIVITFEVPNYTASVKGSSI